MEGSRDTSHSLHPSDELEDDSGLELSLGLSCVGSRSKCKALEGATAVDFTAEHGAAGVGAYDLPKYVRSSGLDAALKKFLERRLDEQDDLGGLLDGYPTQDGAWHSNGSLNKEQEIPISLCNIGSVGVPAEKTYQEKRNQLHSVSGLDSGGNTVLSKDTQLFDGFTVSWGQVAEQVVPLPLTNALKTGLVGESTVLMHHFAEELGHEDGNKAELQRQALLQKHDGFEQQRKFQEERKRRKGLIGEQNQQKKVREEDDKMRHHGFRRPASNTWVLGLDSTAPALDAQKTLLSLQQGEEVEQVQPEIRPSSQLERVRADMESSFEADQDESEGLPDDDSKSLNFIPQLKPQDIGKFSSAGTGQVSGVLENAGHLRIMQTPGAVHESPDRMAATKSVLVLSSNNQEEEPTVILCERPGSPSARQSPKTSCSNSSTGVDITEEKEEQSCGEDGEASSAPCGSTGSDTVAASTSTPSPYPLTSFPILSTPYSIPTPALNASGTPFSMGFSFPHLFAPPTSDGQKQTYVRPVTRSTFQLPSGQGYPNQIPALEDTPSSIQVLRPPSTSQFTAPSSRITHNWTSTGVVEEDNSRPQGSMVQENGTGQQYAASTTDKSAVEHQPLYKCLSVHCAQDPAVPISESYQAPNLHSLSSLSVPVVQHYGPIRTLSDPGELRSFKEQGGINAFPGFAASVQAAQSLPGAPRPSSNRVEDRGARQEQAKLCGKTDSTALQQVLQTEDTCNTGSGGFQQGNAELFPLLDGSAKELANLKPGIPPGLRFGGTGSSPDLPWVSTTGAGPNGKTVCGVLYRFSRSQVKIVCFCHGKHMSPSEFVQHAGGVEVSNPEKNIMVNPFV